MTIEVITTGPLVRACIVGKWEVMVRIGRAGITSDLLVIRPELGRTMPSRIKSNFPQRDFWTGMASECITVAVQYCSALFNDPVMWRKVPRA